MISVTLPIRTTNPLNNAQGISRGAMFRKAAERKQQRTITGLAVRAALQKQWVAPPYVIVLSRIAPSDGFDDDNLGASMKSVRDGTTDALGYTNDRHQDLEWRYAQWRGRKGRYEVVIEIESRAAGVPASEVE
jgi:hypothetical protein